MSAEGTNHQPRAVHTNKPQTLVHNYKDFLVSNIIIINSVKLTIEMDLG